MRRYSLNVHAVRYTSAFGHSCRLNWLAIVPDEPTRAKGYLSWTPPRPDTLLFRASLPLLIICDFGGIIRSSSLAYSGFAPQPPLTVAPVVLRYLTFSGVALWVVC